MNSHRPLIYSLVAAALLSGCVAREHHRSHVHRTWEAGTIKNIEVREVSGAINVQATPGTSIDLDANIDVAGRPEKKEYFEATVEGDTLVIGRKDRGRHHFRFFGMNDVRVDYDLRVPPEVALDLHTVNGRVTTHGVGGETDVTTVNGSILVETPGEKEVTAHTVNGRIECRFSKNFQGASFKTVNGRVIAVLPQSASFVGDFSQVNGDIEAAFPLNIHSHPGSRRVTGEVNGGQHELKIVTVNGDIKIENGGASKAPTVLPDSSDGPERPERPELPEKPEPPAPPKPPVT